MPMHVTVQQNDFEWNSDLNWEACSFATEVANNRTKYDTSFKEALWLVD